MRNECTGWCTRNMPTRRHSSPWAPLRILGPLLIVLGALVAPLAVALNSAHGVLSEEGRFVAAFAPLAADPDVQEGVEDRVMEDLDVPGIVEEMLPGHLPDWLSGSAELLNYLGVPSSVIDPDEIEEDSRASLDEIESIAADAIDRALRAGMRKALASDEAATVWQEALRESHPQILTRLRTAAVLPDGLPEPLLVDVQPIVSAAREALVDEGAGFAEYIPDLPENEYRVALLSSEQMQSVGASAAFILRFGESAPWISAGLIAAGVLIARRRSTWILIGAVLGAAAALGTRASITSGVTRDAITSAASSDPIGNAALRTFLDAALQPTLPALLWIIGGWAALAALAVIVKLLRRRGTAQADPPRIFEDPPARP